MKNLTTLSIALVVACCQAVSLNASQEVLTCKSPDGKFALRCVYADSQPYNGDTALDKPPEFEPGDVYGVTTGKFGHEDGLWKTTITLKGDLCVYDASHPSGHFKKLVWKKRVGLVEYASGYGAHADGFRLKRQK